MTYPPAEGVIVAFSGGKDSLVVLDLAVKHFPRVEAFFMYFLPDLEYSQVVIDYAERRFGLKIRQYPHWQLAGMLNVGTCTAEVPDLRDSSMQATIAHARAETGLHWCGLGYREQESLLQRRWLGRKGWCGALHDDGRWAPLRAWKKRELVAYLRRHRLVIPGLSADKGLRPSGIDLSPDTMKTFRERWPRDYQRIINLFPWAVDTDDKAEQLAARWKAHAARRRAYDAQRGNASSRGYDWAWQKLRKAHLEAEPYCRECLRDRRVRVLAKHLDHIIPKREFAEGRVEGDPNARENLQPLCHECHSRKTALEDSHFAGARMMTA